MLLASASGVGGGCAAGGCAAAAAVAKETVEVAMVQVMGLVEAEMARVEVMAEGG